MCQLGGAVVFCVFAFLFPSLALQYTIVFAFAYHYSILFRCLLFYNFYLTVLTSHLFMASSRLKCIHFITLWLKCFHCNFLNVNVHIFILAVCSLKD